MCIRDRNKHADRLANEAMDAGRLGRRWEPSGSTASLDASAARNASAPPPSGPPGDARAGAARARAALSTTAAGTSTSTRTSAPTGAGAGARPAAGDGLFAAEEATAASSTPTASGDFEAEAGAPAPTGQAARTRTDPGPAPTGAEPDRAAATGTGATRSDAPAPVSVQPRGASPQGWAAPDTGAPATFVLLRHGETALTPEKRFSGSGGTDPELSAAGLRQAEAVAAALAARGTIQEIVSSPLTRCRQTAAAVAARLGLDVRIEQGLRETDFGAWEGLTFGEVRERYPEDLDAWLASPKAAPTGGGESFATVARRVAATRDRLTAAHAGRTVLLVTHVTPIKTLVRLALGAPPESLFRMELSAASISAVAYYADGNASVRLLNDTSHLR